MRGRAVRPQHSAKSHVCLFSGSKRSSCTTCHLSDSVESAQEQSQGAASRQQQRSRSGGSKYVLRSLSGVCQGLICSQHQQHSQHLGLSPRIWAQLTHAVWMPSHRLPDTSLPLLISTPEASSQHSPVEFPPSFPLPWEMHLHVTSEVIRLQQ